MTVTDAKDTIVSMTKHCLKSSPSEPTAVQLLQQHRCGLHWLQNQATPQVAGRSAAAKQVIMEHPYNLAMRTTKRTFQMVTCTHVSLGI